MKVTCIHLSESELSSLSFTVRVILSSFLLSHCRLIQTDDNFSRAPLLCTWCRVVTDFSESTSVDCQKFCVWVCVGFFNLLVMLCACSCACVLQSVLMFIKVCWHFWSLKLGTLELKYAFLVCSCLFVVVGVFFFGFVFLFFVVVFFLGGGGSF